jgi:hypothetical protein
MVASDSGVQGTFRHRIDAPAERLRADFRTFHVSRHLLEQERSWLDCNNDPAEGVLGIFSA